MNALKRTLLGALSPGGSRARLLIVTFHRVLPAFDPLLPGEPDTARFSQQMATLAEFCNVLPLPEAARRLADGSLPPRAACVTFDDGYLNNLECAAPILARFGLPATVFIAQNAIETGIMWNDLVIEAIRRARGRLDLSVIGEESVELQDDRARAALIDRVLSALKYRPLDERWRLTNELYRRATGSEPPRLMLTESDIRKLAASGFDIGGHTVHHPILAELAPAQARSEIVDCADWLQQVVGRRPVSFAYPNGRPGRDFKPEHAEMAREAGFELAVSTAPNCATRSADRYALPRWSLPESSPADVFKRVLKTYVLSYR